MKSYSSMVFRAVVSANRTFPSIHSVAVSDGNPINFTVESQGNVYVIENTSLPPVEVTWTFSDVTDPSSSTVCIHNAASSTQHILVSGVTVPSGSTVEITRASSITSGSYDVIQLYGPSSGSQKYFVKDFNNGSDWDTTDPLDPFITVCQASDLSNVSGSGVPAVKTYENDAGNFDEVLAELQWDANTVVMHATPFAGRAIAYIG